ncbi:MAG: AmmeMemoRadiSam system protein A [Bacteroidota bacterium]
MDLTQEEKTILLEAARKSITLFFAGGEISEPDYKKYPVLKTHSGAFVTLSEQGKLRGCIGFIISDKPLFKTVCEAAVNAAQNDPRFNPLSQDELSSVSIEISVLSEPFPLKSYDEIEIGKHGLILEEKGRRGLLLPQVPVEHQMNKEQYLDAICLKSGFNAGYWREKQLKLSGFTAVVFSEKLLTKVE